MEMLGLVGGDLGVHDNEVDAMKSITPELVLSAGNESLFSLLPTSKYLR